MPELIIKKKTVTYTPKNLSQINKDIYKSINTWKDRSGKHLVVGVTLSWTDYSNQAQSKDIVIIADKKITDSELDSWITNTECKPLEVKLRDYQVMTLKELIKSSEEYE